MVFDNNTWLLKTRPNFSKLVCLTERRTWIYRDAVKLFIVVYSIFGV